MIKRISYQGGYLYCSVDSQVSNYTDLYDSFEECLSAIRPDIIADCKERGYTEEETAEVISAYEIEFSNSGAEWKNIYDI